MTADGRMVALLGSAQGAQGGEPAGYANDPDPGAALRAVVAEVRAAAAATEILAAGLRRN